MNVPIHREWLLDCEGMPRMQIGDVMPAYPEMSATLDHLSRVADHSDNVYTPTVLENIVADLADQGLFVKYYVIA